MGLHAYRSNARGLPGCTWRLQKPSERAWARLALSIKRRNPGWRNYFLSGSVVPGCRGASHPVCFSNLSPTCHLVPLHNRSTWSNWSACQRIPRLTGSSRAVHSPLHVFPFYFSPLSSNGRNTSNYLLRRGCQSGVARVYYTVFHVRTLPRGF